jgi:hypothetical protein
MTFTVVKKSNQGRRSGHYTAPMVQVAKYNKQGMILLSSVQMDRLGWKFRDKIEISIGSGDDNGLIALRRGADGYAITNAGKRNGQGKVTCHAILGHAAKVPSTPCKYEIVADTLYIQLPARLMAPEAREVETVYRAPAFTNGQLVAAE